ncbi:putative monovalent cation/H+ antiporter subunit F [uncultured Roseburia sp.]|uniref:Monovalent cation/H+ antiporter complex subunit F n=1 Tax=Brotonthovivens ammoniilytica TaxID=2981725 RepID=A0ABT2TLV2_9FIRM|nr:monovalent cation/H+ antiporter complex subunit F [Brotonthovivens ammoniilytica]MCU6763131.1 monovalent cation/H+ antiporter complex subunit F [Brotonthovivens ammoniilytica]SCJ04242.1 putative monovalent cation/H+ antiporter subunit F [uncultured Roseburia sp.]
MHTIYLIIMAVLLFIIFLMVIKMIKGPSIYDRMNGLSVIGANVVILLVLYGFLDGRPEMFIDIAIAYGILGFVTNIIVAKYLGGKK